MLTMNGYSPGRRFAADDARRIAHLWRSEGGYGGRGQQQADEQRGAAIHIPVLLYQWLEPARPRSVPVHRLGSRDEACSANARTVSAMRCLRQSQADKCERHPAWIGMAFVVPA
jgi:hypothetical protein